MMQKNIKKAYFLVQKIFLPAKNAIASPATIAHIHQGFVYALRSGDAEISAPKKNAAMTTSALLVACATIDSHSEPDE